MKFTCILLLCCIALCAHAQTYKGITLKHDIDTLHAFGEAIPICRSTERQLSKFARTNYPDYTVSQEIQFLQQQFNTYQSQMNAHAPLTGFDKVDESFRKLHGYQSYTYIDISMYENEYGVYKRYQQKIDSAANAARLAEEQRELAIKEKYEAEENARKQRAYDSTLKAMHAAQHLPDSMLPINLSSENTTEYVSDNDVGTLIQNWQQTGLDSYDDFLYSYGSVKEYNLEKGVMYNSPHHCLVLMIGGKPRWIVRISQYLANEGYSNDCVIDDGVINVHKGWISYTMHAGVSNKRNDKVVVKALIDLDKGRTTSVLITGNTEMLVNMFLYYWTGPGARIQRQSLKHGGTIYRDVASDRVTFDWRNANPIIRVSKNPRFPKSLMEIASDSTSNK